MLCKGYHHYEKHHTIDFNFIKNKSDPFSIFLFFDKLRKTEEVVINQAGE